MSAAYTRLRSLLHFSLFNCTRIRAEATVSRGMRKDGRTKKKEERKRKDRRIIPTSGLCWEWQKRAVRSPPYVRARARARAKIPKHNITVLFATVSVNMRDYERRAAQNVQP